MLCFPGEISRHTLHYIHIYLYILHSLLHRWASYDPLNSPNNPINPDYVYVSSNRHRECFVCSGCQGSVERPFAVKHNKPYCTNCIKNQDDSPVPQGAGRDSGSGRKKSSSMNSDPTARQSVREMRQNVSSSTDRKANGMKLKKSICVCGAVLVYINTYIYKYISPSP